MKAEIFKNKFAITAFAILATGIFFSYVFIVIVAYVATKKDSTKNDETDLSQEIETIKNDIEELKSTPFISTTEDGTTVTQGEQGEKGDKGDKGDPGIEGVDGLITETKAFYAGKTISSGSTGTANATCEPGWSLLSGGCRLQGYVPPDKVYLTQTYGAGNTWFCQADNLSASSVDLQGEIICYR